MDGADVRAFRSISEPADDNSSAVLVSNGGVDRAIFKLDNVSILDIGQAVSLYRNIIL